VDGRSPEEGCLSFKHSVASGGGGSEEKPTRVVPWRARVAGEVKRRPQLGGAQVEWSGALHTSLLSDDLFQVLLGAQC
jgi:hypothetical protein